MRVLGNTPVFQAPRDSQLATSRHLMDSCLRRAYKRAGIEPKPGEVFGTLFGASGFMSTIRNIGDATAGSSVAVVWLTGSGGSNATYMCEGTVGTLAAGSSTPFQGSCTIPQIPGLRDRQFHYCNSL